jgi:hypothetical protein
MSEFVEDVSTPSYTTHCFIIINAATMPLPPLLA